MAIQPAKAFNQLPFEPGAPLRVGRRPPPLVQRALGGAEEQRPIVRGGRAEVSSIFEIGRFLLEGRSMLALPRAHELTRGALIVEKAAFEETWRRFFVPPGEEILPHVLTVETRERDEVQPYLVSLRNLIEHEQIAAARRMLNALPLRFLDDREINRLRKILTPPTIRKTPRRDSDRRSDYEWIRANEEAYRGQWVALDEGRLLAAATSLRELREQLKALQLERPPLIHRIQ